MDFAASSMTGSGGLPALRPVPDMRPAADAAAIRRDTKPALAVAAAMPSPPSTLQIGAVSRSMISGATATEPGGSTRIPAVAQAERTLKPYGISMLPAEERDAPNRPEPEQSAADSTKAEH